MATGQPDISKETCPASRRADGPWHSWIFDGDNPYIVCAYCDEMRDALTGRQIRPPTARRP
jgi:hypothetical protein